MKITVYLCSDTSQERAEDIAEAMMLFSDVLNAIVVAESKPMEGRCLSCGQTGKMKTIQARGYLWHVPCANVRRYADGTLYVDFPSDGKIAPDTIMTGGVGSSWLSKKRTVPPAEKRADD